ncbi:hypothetical protein Q1695_005359 [Nippostrongylus brasiliensis]|nr:hypothetical protein Q1695_005359 [Nippostrongylus brasiliensis]
MRQLAVWFLLILTIIATANYVLIVVRAPKGHRLTDVGRGYHTTTHNGKFCVAFNVTKAEGSFRQDGLEPITLAIHTTTQYLHILDEQIRSWDGPISLSLFVEHDSLAAVQYLIDWHKCNSTISQKLSVHIVHQLAAFQEQCQPISRFERSVHCDNFTLKYKNGFPRSLMSPFAIYPINVMRNVARRGAPSKIHLVSDIEMIFSEKFALRAKKLANEHIRKGSRKLLVIRRFELEKGVPVPRNHADLKKLVDKRRAHEYHHKLFPRGHTIEALWEWFKRSKAKPEPYVWEIPYKSSAWEPQLILHATDPMNEEGMPTRLRDQQALVYELCRANYKFLMVSQLFNVHRGVKRNNTKMDYAVIEHQSQLKNRSYARYIKRINSAYPKTTKRCGIFRM